MIPDLEIRVLFCYSPEFANTYYNLYQLQADNAEMCYITQDILRHNITNYAVNVTLANTIEVAILQMQDNVHYNCLIHSQIEQLVQCLTPESLHNNPIKFGGLPAYLLQQKQINQATILILQVLICPVTRNPVAAIAARVGARNGRDNVIVLCRGMHAKGAHTSYWRPSVLAHEFGHLMGCRHPYGNGWGLDSSLDNSHGHCLYDINGNILVGTIMSYAKNIIFYYSNPYMFRYPPPYQNFPCGIVGESEAYLTVRANVPKLAGIF